ncbi:MAG: hypothetical protein LBT51_08135 [Fusobacteriaceae bacterium]|nr:hypothetical protein [Fusobacteriaceae bacterium]
MKENKNKENKNKKNKNKKILKIGIIIMIFTLLTSVSFGKPKISIERENQGQKQLVVHYDENRVIGVRIGRQRITSGVPYYLTPGKYFIEYTNKVLISASFEYGYGRKGRTWRNNDDHDNDEAEPIEIKEDMEIEITGNKYQIKVGASTSL